MPGNAHDRAVTGVAGDLANKLLVSAGLDSWLRIWDFRAATCRAHVLLPAPASKLAFHPASSLAALACDDWVVRMCAPCAMPPGQLPGIWEWS